MVGGAALDGGGDDLAGAGIGLILVLGLDLLDHERLLMHDVVLQAVDEEGLGLLRMLGRRVHAERDVDMVGYIAVVAIRRHWRREGTHLEGVADLGAET